MKSPLYILAVLLPLATELAVASPAAEPDYDSLEERNGGGGGGGGGGHGGHGDDFHNSCRVNHRYWYYKYPCGSSDRKGQENPGSQWSASCRYQNWYQTPKGWCRQEDKPQGCHGNWEHSC